MRSHINAFCAIDLLRSIKIIFNTHISIEYFMNIILPIVVDVDDEAEVEDARL